MTLAKLRKIYGQDNVGTLSKGFRVISKNGKIGLYSETLEKMITDFEFEADNRYATVDDYGQNTWKFINFKKNEKYAYFHVYNEEIIQLTPYIYDKPLYFGGRSRTSCIINGKYGLVEEGGDKLYEIIPAKYDYIKHSGAGIVLNKNGKCGLFNRTPKSMLNLADPFIFDDIYLPENKWDTFKFKIKNHIFSLYKEQIKDKHLFIKKILEG